MQLAYLTLEQCNVIYHIKKTHTTKKCRKKAFDKNVTQV